MVDKQPIIQSLQKKADEAKQKSHWWDTVSWIGLLGSFAADFVAKPSWTRSIASWGGLITSLVANMWSSSLHSRSSAFEESISEIKNATDIAGEDNKTDWQQKVTTSPSQEVAPTVIGR